MGVGRLAKVQVKSAHPGHLSGGAGWRKEGSVRGRYRARSVELGVQNIDGRIFKDGLNNEVPRHAQLLIDPVSFVTSRSQQALCSAVWSSPASPAASAKVVNAAVC